MEYIFSQKVASLKASAIREILKFTADPSVISFAAGSPAPSAFPTKEIAEISQKILEQDPIASMQYGITEGYLPLRNTLKETLGKENMFDKNYDELIITSGGQQGNELSCKVLLDEGDTLICEAPSFIGSLNAFKSYRVNLVGVPLQNDGIDLDLLEKAIKENKNVKVLYLIPNFQNPTGLTMSLEKRKAVLELAKKYNFVILEDDPYSKTRFNGEHIPAIKSLDTDGHVIYCSSFSKVIAPGFRVGYVSGHKDIVDKIVVCKQVADVHTNAWAQNIVHKFMTEYDFASHVAKLPAIYKQKCNLMIENLEANFSKKVTFTRPDGGLFIWCSLPDDCDMMSFCKRSVEEFKVAVVPGTAFMMKESDKTTSFRLNFSTPSDEQIIKGCELIGKLSKEMF